MTAHIDIRKIARAGDSRIILLVVDGLGGYPHPDTGRSELEAARLPNLDALARESACGQTVPVAQGITPGSGPGHLALLGYDPARHHVGRGVMEALGVGLDLADEDAAARGNFCIVDNKGQLVDRRAGRICSERGAETDGPAKWNRATARENLGSRGTRPPLRGRVPWSRIESGGLGYRSRYGGMPASQIGATNRGFRRACSCGEPALRPGLGTR